MTKRATVTEAEMRRAIKVAVECGLTVRECEMTRDKVRLIFTKPDFVDEPPRNSDTLKPKEWPRR